MFQQSLLSKFGFSLAFFLLLLASLLYGPTPLEELLNKLYPRLSGAIFWHPIIDERLPRLIVCLCSGASLACAGSIMQALFQNPLASPSVLGCTFGGSLLVSLVFASQLHAAYPFLIAFAAVGGCFLSLLLVYFMALKDGRLQLHLLLLAGIALSTVFASIQSSISYIFRDDWALVRTLKEWESGQTYDLNWVHVHLQFPLTLLGLGIAHRYRAELNLLSLGEQEACILGVEVKKVRFRLLLAVAALTGGTLSSCGIISFFGLILPHIIRKSFGSNNLTLIPLSIFGGAFAFCLLDFTLRASQIQAFSIGNISSVFGGLFFLILLYQQKQKLFES